MFGLMIYITVPEGHVGLRYDNGRYDRTLPPGRYRLRRLPWRVETVTIIDLRRQLLALNGQEMLTADGLTVRLNVSVEYRVVDAPRAAHSVAAYGVTLYSVLQIALRDEVQGMTLDALLADRGAVGTRLRERAQASAAELGLELISVGLKDVILSGEIKKLLAQETEALRTGQAALVAAREEVATTRARANTARLMTESPGLLRLREIEALVEVARGDGNTVILALPRDDESPAR